MMTGSSSTQGDASVSPVEEESCHSSDSDSCGNGHDSAEDEYMHACRQAMSGLLVEAKCSVSEAKRIVRACKIRVSDCGYEDCDEVRFVDCTTTIPSMAKVFGRAGLAAGDANAKLTIVFSYHHRTRAYSIEHFCSLKFSLITDAAAAPNPRQTTIMSSTLIDLRRYGLQDEYDGGNEIEKRKFSLSAAALKRVRKAIFGRFKGMTLHHVLLIIYAAVGVRYHNHINGAGANIMTFRDGWLEHYSRIIAGCPTDEDDGYETETLESRIEEERQRQLDNATLDSDEESSSIQYEE